MLYLCSYRLFDWVVIPLFCLFILMFINTDRFQEEYSMNLKRIKFLILALMLAVNTPAALAADAHAGAADGLRRHTVTLTADTLTGKLLPLESAPLP